MDARLIRWERRTQWPLAAAALVFLAAYAWRILATASGNPAPPRQMPVPPAPLLAATLARPAP